MQVKTGKLPMTAGATAFFVFCALSGRADLNVRDFGAVGDGVADDTAAIQRAAVALEKERPPLTFCMTRNLHSAAEQPFPALTFPKGTYRVTGPVVLKGSVCLRGEAGAKIVNARADRETFYCREAFRLIVRGLTFEGGLVQVRQWTHNADRAYLHVADCVFSRAAGTSIVSDSFKWYRGEKGESHNQACESVDAACDTNGAWSVTARDEKDLTPYNNSTLILVERCRFLENATALRLYSDGVTVRQCAFRAPAGATREQIRAGSNGRLGVEMYYRDLTLDYPGALPADAGAIRFEGGRGTFENIRVTAGGDLTMIRSCGRYCDYGTPTCLALRNITLATGEAPVISVAGERGPNRVSAYGIRPTGTPSARRRRLLAYDKEPTRESLDYWMDHAQTMRCIPAESIFGFAFSGIDERVFDLALPAVLEPYRRAATPAGWTRPIAAPDGVTFESGLPHEPVFIGTGFGRPRRNTKTAGDETEAIAALLDQARAAGGGVVELPPKWLRISRTLELPANTLLTCRGRAVIDTADGDLPLFRAPEGADVAFQNIVFADGLHAFESAWDRGRVRFLDCAFCGQKEAAILAHAARPDAYRVEVSGGQGYAPYLYRGNARCVFDVFWYQEAPERPKGTINASYSAIVNETGGSLTLREVLGVPCYFYHMPKNEFYGTRLHPEITGEYRWVDNYGTLSSINVRYGGEWSGMTPIYHFGDAVTYLEGGTIELGGTYMASGQAAVVADTPKADVTIVDAASSVCRHPIAAVVKTATGYDGLAGCKRAMNFPYSNFEPIWPKGKTCETNAFYGFTAEFDWDGKGAPRLEIEASSIARIWLNGKYVGYGPARAPKGWSRRDAWMLPATVGRNVLAIEVSAYNVNTFYILNQPGYLYAQVICGEHALAQTGLNGAFRAKALDHRVKECTRMSYQRAFSEVYEMTPQTDAWRTTGIAAAEALPLEPCWARPRLERVAPRPNVSLYTDLRPLAETRVRMDRTTPDSAFKTPRYITLAAKKLPSFPCFANPARNLQDELRRLAVERVTACAKDAAGDGMRPYAAGDGVVFDLGRGKTGFPGVRVRCMKPGRLYLGFSETLEKNGVPNPTRNQVANGVAWDLTEPGDYDLEAFEMYNFRYLHVVLLTGAAEIARPTVRLYENPEASRARFSCSDAGLVRIFEAARATFAQNAVDTFIDCPGRERGGYSCDAFFTSRVAPLLCGNTSVERCFFENETLATDFPDLPEGMLPMLYPGDATLGETHYIPNWAMWFFIQADEYLARSGDPQMAIRLRSRYFKLLDWFARYRNADGLLEKIPGWIFVEWSRANRLVRDVNYPSNMTYAQLLEFGARHYDRPDLAAEAEKIRETVRRQSWTGSWFCDNAVRQKDGSLKLSGECTETCQYYAFFFKTATKDRHPDLWKRLVTDFGPDRKATGKWPEIHPSNAFIGNYLRLECLSREGLSAQAVAEARGFFLHMADRTGTLWENIDEHASCCHGFASHAAVLLLRDALGVRAIDPVAKTVRFSPPSDSTLDWCKARLPLTSNRVGNFSWKKDAAGRIVRSVTLPEGWTEAKED